MRFDRTVDHYPVKSAVKPLDVLAADDHMIRAAITFPEVFALKVRATLVSASGDAEDVVQDRAIRRSRTWVIVAMSMQVQAIESAPSTSALSASGVMQCAVNSGW